MEPERGWMQRGQGRACASAARAAKPRCACRAGSCTLPVSPAPTLLVMAGEVGVRAAGVVEGGRQGEHPPARERGQEKQKEDNKQPLGENRP